MFEILNRWINVLATQDWLVIQFICNDKDRIGGSKTFYKAFLIFAVTKTLSSFKKIFNNTLTSSLYLNTIFTILTSPKIKIMSH